MINFWSYKSEYKRLNKKFLKSINISLKRGNIFFGDELKKFEKNFLKRIEQNMALQLEVVPKH